LTDKGYASRVPSEIVAARLWPGSAFRMRRLAAIRSEAGMKRHARQNLPVFTGG